VLSLAESQENEVEKDDMLSFKHTCS
jgi:hypothetical protein